MHVVHRLNGYKPVSAVIEQLQHAIDEHGQEVAIARADKAERDLSRRLREEQNSAYQESLRRDQEKKRQQMAKEAETKRAAEEEMRKLNDAEAMVKRRLDKREELLRTLPAEPTSGARTKIVFRLPDGSRVSRQFLENDTVALLYHFAGTHDLHLEHDDFRLVSNFPRQEFNDRETTLKEAGLVPNGMVVVEEVIQLPHK
jgi:FAS-associated factor 2